MYCISQTPVHLRLRTASGIQVTFHYVLGSHREVTAAQGFSHSEHSGWIKGLGSYIHKEPNHTASCNWLVADSVFMSLSPTSPSSMYGKQNKTQDIQLMLNIENTKTIISQLSPEIDEYLAGPVLIACRHHLTNISSEFFFFFQGRTLSHMVTICSQTEPDSAGERKGFSYSPSHPWAGPVSALTQTHPGTVNDFNSRTFFPPQKWDHLFSLLMSQGCSEYQQVHISQALWFLQTKGSAELQSMIIQPNGLCGVFEMTREEADRLLVPTVALPIAKLPQSPSPRQGQPSGSHAVSALGCTLPYIVNGEGIPLCAYFQFTFPNSIGKHTDFSCD